MEFSLIKDSESELRDNVVLKLCNKTNNSISFMDSIHYGIPFYTVSYEIKKENLPSTIINGSFWQPNKLESAFIDSGYSTKKMHTLRDGECKSYDNRMAGLVSFYYTRLVENEFRRKAYDTSNRLTKDELEEMRPKQFRVHVTIMAGTYNNPKSKGVTFRSKWFDAPRDWFPPTDLMLQDMYKSLQKKSGEN